MVASDRQRGGERVEEEPSLPNDVIGFDTTSLDEENKVVELDQE